MHHLILISSFALFYDVIGETCTERVCNKTSDGVAVVPLCGGGMVRW